MTTATGQKVNEIILEINEMCKKAEDSISMLQNAFFYNKFIFVGEAERIAGEIGDREASLTAEAVEEAQRNPELKAFVSIPGHLERISDHARKIAQCIAEKIRDNILFSDKAVSEITFLMQRTKEILNTVSDYVLARNIFIANYLGESEQEIERSATKFSTLHEERLIEGVCSTRASSLYLHILDSIKGIAWHTRQIAEKLIAS